MQPDQEKHLKRIKNQTCRLIEAKYRRGQQQHGGDLFTMDPLMLLTNAIDEAIDQVVYLLTLRERMLKALKCRKS